MKIQFYFKPELSYLFPNNEKEFFSIIGDVRERMEGESDDKIIVKEFNVDYDKKRAVYDMVRYFKQVENNDCIKLYNLYDSLMESRIYVYNSTETDISYMIDITEDYVSEKYLYVEITASFKNPINFIEDKSNKNSKTYSTSGYRVSKSAFMSRYTLFEYLKTNMPDIKDLDKKWILGARMTNYFNFILDTVDTIYNRMINPATEKEDDGSELVGLCFEFDTKEDSSNGFVHVLVSMPKPR